jgi:hypothetical protein
LDDGRLLRDERWLLQIGMHGGGEKFFDCGDHRDGQGYQDVTDSSDPEAQAARTRFASILASIPEPKPHGLAPNKPKLKDQKANGEKKGEGKKKKQKDKV